MVKYIQTIWRQQPTNCLSSFDHFVDLALKGLNIKFLLALKYWTRVRNMTLCWSNSLTGQCISGQRSHFIPSENTDQKWVKSKKCKVNTFSVFTYASYIWGLWPKDSLNIWNKIYTYVLSKRNITKCFPSINEIRFFNEEVGSNK